MALSLALLGNLDQQPRAHRPRRHQESPLCIHQPAKGPLYSVHSTTEEVPAGRGGTHHLCGQGCRMCLHRLFRQIWEKIITKVRKTNKVAKAIARIPPSSQHMFGGDHNQLSMVVELCKDLSRCRETLH